MNTRSGLCAICHEVIETQHVFSENNQVYLKKEQDKPTTSLGGHEQWFPINFQWIPVMELQNNLEINKYNRK